MKVLLCMVCDVVTCTTRIRNYTVRSCKQEVVATSVPPGQAIPGQLTAVVANVRPWVLIRSLGLPNLKIYTDTQRLVLT
jgi:hypothetical protein